MQELMHEDTSFEEPWQPTGYIPDNYFADVDQMIQN